MDKKKTILEDPNFTAFIKERVKGHPLFEIISNINTYIDESKEYDDPDAWSMLCYHIDGILTGNQVWNMYRHAEGWLHLGELRCQCRLVANANPDTEEQDEIFYRENPHAIVSDFESFIGVVIASMNDYAKSEVPRSLIN